MKSVRPVLFLTVGLAFFTACGQSATAPALPAGTVPRYDGGLTFGGGGFADTTSTTSTNTTTVSTSCTTEAERGGLTFGGGGYTAPPPCTP